MNYYERHLGDYAKDTAHLSMLEHGAYTLLLDRYYGTDQPIPADQAHRVARARSKDEKDAVDAVLSEFFVLTDGAWVNKRADEEIAKAKVKISAAKENGKRGGRPKKEPASHNSETEQKPTGLNQNNPTETQQKPTGLFTGSENETQEKAHQTPDTRHHTNSHKAATDSESVGQQADFAAAIQARAIELTAMLRQRGAALQASDPNVQQWAASGVTDAQALTALETAVQRRQQQASTQPVNAGLLNAIIKDQKAQGAAQNGKPPAKFDPVEYVNRNRTGGDHAEHGNVIDVTP